MHPDDEPDRLPVKDFYMEYAPTFKADLQLMVQDDKGNLCSYCMIWYSEELRIGMFEPVCTREDYRMRGIGKAMLTEGLRRLKKWVLKRPMSILGVITYANSITVLGLLPMTMTILGKRNIKLELDDI